MSNTSLGVALVALSVGAGCKEQDDTDKLLEALKRACDPAGILAPGNVL